MIFFNETVTAPFSGIILQRKVNISAVAGNSSIVLSLWDPHGVQYDFTIQAGQKMQQRDFDLFRFQIQGSGQAAIALSYPELIDPSIQTTLNPDLPQSITTPQLPPSLDSNGKLETRYLSGTDNPDMSVNQSQQYAITESVVSGFATYNASGYFGATDQYVRLSFSIPANGFLKIKKIYIQTPIYPGRFRLGDEIGFFDNMWILYRNVTWLMSYYQAIVEDADFGPDTTLGATAPGQYGAPYTKTSGINESFYGLPQNFNSQTNRNVPTGTIRLIDSANIYQCTAPIVVYTDWNITIEGSVPYGTNGGGPSTGPPYEMYKICTTVQITSNTGGFAVHTIVTTAGLPTMGFLKIKDVLFLQNGLITNAPSSQLNYYMCNLSPSLSGGGNDQFQSFAFENVGFYDITYLSSGNSATGNAGLYCNGNGSVNYIRITNLWIAGNIDNGYLFYWISMSHATIDRIDLQQLFPNTLTGKTIMNWGTGIANNIIELHIFGSYQSSTNLWQLSTISSNGISAVPPLEIDSLYIEATSVNDIFGYIMGGNMVVHNYFAPVVNPFTGAGARNPTHASPTNWIKFDMSVFKTNQVSQPSIPAIVSGTVYSNDNPCDIYISIPITFPTTASTAMSAYLRVGTSSTAGANPIFDQFSEPATLATASGRIWALKAKVPAGYYYEVDVTNATIGTAEVQAA